MNGIPPNPTATRGREAWPGVLGRAAHEVFAVMLGSKLATAAEPFSGEEIDITAMVGLAGQICGVVTIRCTAEAAGLMAANMLGMEAAAAGPEIWDAVGELCNMIAGDFKHKLADGAESCMISVPTVISGADYTLRALADSDQIEINLRYEGHPLIVSLQVHSQQSF
jgi:chemotaxis protein CheX